MARIVYMIFNTYALGLILYVIMSWIPQMGNHAARKWLERWYAPFLDKIRKGMGTVQMGNARVDFAPGVLLLAIVVIREIVTRLIMIPA